MKNDLTGQRFGKLTVLGDSGQRDSARGVLWNCRCDCGGECAVSTARLREGRARNCGCDRPRSHNWRDLTGRRFGRLTVVREAPEKSRADKTAWHCRCDCGAEVDVMAGSLLRGLTKSCGCLNREKNRKMHEHMHYRDDTCVEQLRRSCSDSGVNSAGFRGLFLTKTGKYRASITFRKRHYTLGYYGSFDEAVRARLDAEQSLHAGYLKALEQYERYAKADPAWAEENPFYYNVTRKNGEFLIYTNGEAAAC